MRWRFVLSISVDEVRKILFVRILHDLKEARRQGGTEFFKTLLDIQEPLKLWEEK